MVHLTGSILELRLYEDSLWLELLAYGPVLAFS
jgi:hypothetical protein